MIIIIEMIWEQISWITTSQIAPIWSCFKPDGNCDVMCHGNYRWRSIDVSWRHKSKHEVLMGYRPMIKCKTRNKNSFALLIFLWTLEKLTCIGGFRGGRIRRAPPLRDPILSFWHTNFTKRSRLHAPPTRSTPPTGNPGSATDLYYLSCWMLKIWMKHIHSLIGVWIDTYVFYQSVLQKKTWIWSLCVAKT